MLIKFKPEALDRCKIQGLFSLQMKVDIKVMSLFFSPANYQYSRDGLEVCWGVFLLLAPCLLRLTNTLLNMCR